MSAAHQMCSFCAVRYALDEQMIITSGYRTSAHQRSLPGGRETGSHVDAEAVDVRCHHELAWRLQKIAIFSGATGIGVHQNGAIEDRYLHIDRWMDAPSDVRPRLWDY